MCAALWHLAGWLGLVWARARDLLRWQAGYNTQTHAPPLAIRWRDNVNASIHQPL